MSHFSQNQEGRRRPVAIVLGQEVTLISGEESTVTRHAIPDDFDKKFAAQLVIAGAAMFEGRNFDPPRHPNLDGEAPELRSTTRR